MIYFLFFLFYFFLPGKFWYDHGCTGRTAFDSLVNKTTLTIIYHYSVCVIYDLFKAGRST